MWKNGTKPLLSPHEFYVTVYNCPALRDNVVVRSVVSVLWLIVVALSLKQKLLMDGANVFYCYCFFFSFNSKLMKPLLYDKFTCMLVKKKNHP